MVSNMEGDTDGRVMRPRTPHSGDRQGFEEAARVAEFTGSHDAMPLLRDRIAQRLSLDPKAELTAHVPSGAPDCAAA